MSSLIYNYNYISMRICIAYTSDEIAGRTKEIYCVCCGVELSMKTSANERDSLKNTLCHKQRSANNKCISSSK